MYGQVGVLNIDKVNDRVQCHICGRWFRALGTHLRSRHGWTADDYREEFGLNRGQSLVCESTHQRLRDLNYELGNWKHLVSQTLTKDDLRAFLADNRSKIELRPQAILLKSEMFSRHDPLNQPEAQELAQARLKERWYGSPDQRALGRRNIEAAMETVRNRNLLTKKWTCSCGLVFPTRDQLRLHRMQSGSCR